MITLPLYLMSMSVCLFIKFSVCCLFVRLENVQSSLSLLCVSPMAVAQSSSGSVAIHHLFPVLWMMLCFTEWPLMAETKKAYSQIGLAGALDWGWSLISMIALLLGGVLSPVGGKDLQDTDTTRGSSVLCVCVVARRSTITCWQRRSTRYRRSSRRSDCGGCSHSRTPAVWWCLTWLLLAHSK